MAKHDHEMPWQTDAREAIEKVVNTVQFHKKKRSVTLTVEDENNGQTFEEEFDDLGDLKRRLEEIGGEAWCGSAPRDGGDLLDEPELDDYVADALNAKKVEEFFC